MKNSRLIYTLYLIVGLFLLGSCSGDEEYKEDEIKVSERQLHTFTKGTVGFGNNSPTIVNNYIYIGTSRGSQYAPANDNSFYKLDASLNKIWEYPLGSGEVSGAATLDLMGNIYFVVHEGRKFDEPFSNTITKLYSLDNNGNLRWFRSGFGDHCSFINPATSVDNVIYVGGDKLHAFDINGNNIWNYTEYINFNYNAPIIDPEGNIYFKSEGKVISLDKNGNKRWSFTIEIDYGASNTAFSVDYSKIFVPGANTMYCLRTSDGNKLWEYTIPDMIGKAEFRATPAVDDNDNIYIGTHWKGEGDAGQQTLYAIKSDGSGILWKNVIGADLYSSPALGNDRAVYVGSECGNMGPRHSRLHAIDMATGVTIWSAQLEMDVTWSSPAISNNGTLYIASMDMYTEDSECLRGMVYSFKTNSTGLLSGAGSPRFHEGNSSTGRRE